MTDTLDEDLHGVLRLLCLINAIIFKYLSIEKYVYCIRKL
jgi:hypothetical protein